MNLQDYVMTGAPLDFLVAYAAGFVTFFASCLLPLVPTYLAYLSGVSLSRGEASKKKCQLIKLGLMFVLGFVSVFVLMGAAVTQFSHLLVPYRVWFQRIGGVFFVWMGLSMLGVIKSNFLNKEAKLDSQHWFADNRKLHALLTGFTFGFGWTPCIGPVLAVIIFWASHAASVWLGSMLLLIYGIGLGTPFILIAGLFDKIMPQLRKHQGFTLRMSQLSGLLVLLAGILLIFNQFRAMSMIISSLSHLGRWSI